MSRKPLAVYAITVHGLEIARRLRAALPQTELYVSERLLAQAPDGALPLPFPLGPTLAATFAAYDCHVFLLSVGAAVRLIAPLLVDKKVDPAVICVDDAARFVVCVLSGHVGRGNLFTQQVAEILAAQAVITTASDVLGTLSVDILGRELGWTLEDPYRNVTRGCAAVVNAAPVVFVQETGEPQWWPLDRALPANVKYATSLDAIDPAGYEILLIASDRLVAQTHPQHHARAVIYRPKSLVLGLGCDRDTPAELVERGVQRLLAKHRLALASVKAIATIDLKSDEPALLALSQKYGWPLHTFTAAQLDAVPGIASPSATVQKHVGTRGVAEPAALLAAGVGELLATKEIYTEEGAGRSMTLAIARLPFAQRKVADDA